jgi:HD-like signal output (HDOD) protein
VREGGCGVRILFVDDEQSVLDGLRRTLRGMRGEWEMEFINSPQAALEAVRERPFDIVVSDMRMPGMDGAALLSEIRRLRPETVRFILSGHSEREMIMKSVGPSHQFLSKPCKPEELKDAISRAHGLSALFESAGLKRLASELGSLPPLPSLFRELVAELEQPDASIDRVGAIIGKDVAMSAKVLQLVNSSYFGLQRQVTEVGKAVTYLGLDAISALVLGSQLFAEYEGAADSGAIERLWSTSFRVAHLAQRLARLENADKRIADDAFTAGLLHRVGELLLCVHLPERLERVREETAKRGLPQVQVEREELGATHAEVGAYLLGLWGLPQSIVRAVAFYPEPGKAGSHAFDALTALHAAALLGAGPPPDADACQEVDRAHLAQLGLEHRLAAWREAAREIDSAEASHG